MKKTPANLRAEAAHMRKLAADMLVKAEQFELDAQRLEEQNEARECVNAESSGDPMSDPNEGIEPFEATQFYEERPSLTFLCDAVRAEVHDLRKRVPYVQVGAPACEERLQRILKLLFEVEQLAAEQDHRST